MNNERPAAYFHITDRGFSPTYAAASPWDLSNLSGVAIGGLLAQEIASKIPAGMNVARITVDILGASPRIDTIVTSKVARDGPRLKYLEAEIRSGKRVTARATAMLVRTTDTPKWEIELAHPLPHELAPYAPSTHPGLGDVLQRRMVFGDPREIGPGAMWFRVAIPIIAGENTSPLARAVMIGDQGSSIGSTIPVRQFTFANTDISLHLLRLPEGEWQLIEAVAASAGNGHAVTNASFADHKGIYAYGHQVLFVDPRLPR